MGEDAGNATGGHFAGHPQSHQCNTSAGIPTQVQAPELKAEQVAHVVEAAAESEEEDFANPDTPWKCIDGKVLPSFRIRAQSDLEPHRAPGR
jgi:hypothetical protein